MPFLSAGAFAAGLASVGPGVSGEVVERLVLHYEELRRWSRGLSLIGPGTAAEIVGRHYAESLAALRWLPPAGRLVDLGSGGGFPGLVLALARPDLDTVLVESNERKATFLRLVAQKAGLRCAVAACRVEVLPPEWGGAAVVTSRALRLTPRMLTPSLFRRDPDARLLLWLGRENADLVGWRASAELALPGSEHRRIVALSRESAA